VIAVAQLSRAVEQRPDKRPVLSDLRESGQIEGDADCVLMLYRDDYYDRDTERPGEMDIIVRKNRQGRLGQTRQPPDGQPVCRAGGSPHGHVRLQQSCAKTLRNGAHRLADYTSLHE
jgi:DnaB-like helicase C terminal domain